MRTARGHPLAPPSGIVAVSRLVLFDKIGPGEHDCHWCGEKVRWVVGKGPGAPGALIADHLNWDTHDDRPENLVPSCNTCNHRRTHSGVGPRLRDDEPTVMWGGYRTRAVERTCEYCGAPFLTIPAEVKVGKGRFCSRECGYANRRKKTV